MSTSRLMGLVAIAVLVLSACSSSGSHSSAPTTSSGSTATTSTSPSSASSSTTSSAASGSCYIGRWTSTRLVQVGQGITTNGGAGVVVTISSKLMSFDFTGMQPVIFTGSTSGEGLYSGAEQAPVTFSPSGTFMVLAKGSSNVTFKAKLASAASYGTPISANSFPSGGITGTYNCSGSSLALKVSTPQGPTTYTLARS